MTCCLVFNMLFMFQNPKLISSIQYLNSNMLKKK